MPAAVCVKARGSRSGFQHTRGEPKGTLCQEPLREPRGLAEKTQVGSVEIDLRHLTLEAMFASALAVSLRLFLSTATRVCRVRETGTYLRVTHP